MENQSGNLSFVFLLKIILLFEINFSPSFQVFTPSQEKQLAEYIKKSSKFFFGITVKDIRSMAFKATKIMEIPTPESWVKKEMAGIDWYYSFMSRHNRLTLRTPEQISANRIKSFNRESVNGFFTNLTEVYENNPNFGHRIFNMDETGFPTVPTKTVKVIAEKGSKRVSQFASAERGTNVTMALAVDVLGNRCPPFFIYPRKKIQASYLLNAPVGSVAIGNDSGWMTKNDFDKFMAHFIKYANCRKGTPTLLLLDNHTSHQSLVALKMAIDHDIVVLSFPPHSSHRIQPLDVGVFGPVKKAYNIMVDGWCKSNAGRTFDICQVAGVSAQALNLHASAQNIQNSFQKTGIYPLNPLVFTDADYFAADYHSAATERATREQAGETEEGLLVFGDDDIGRNEEVSTSDPSTSRPTSVMSFASGTSEASTSGLASMSSALDVIGPVHFAASMKKSNRGRKPMQSCVLTSPDKLGELQAQAKKRLENEAKKASNALKKAASKIEAAKVSKKRAAKVPKPPAAKVPKKTPAKDQKKPAPKRTKKKKPSTDSSDDAADPKKNLCHECLFPIEGRRTVNNYIECNDCRLPFHLKCVTKGKTFSVFVCKNCDSEYSCEEEDE